MAKNCCVLGSGWGFVGVWIHSMGSGINLHFPLGWPHEPEKEGKGGEKMFGYSLNSLNENHMQEKKKEGGEKREEGKVCVTKACV